MVEEMESAHGFLGSGWSFPVRFTTGNLQLEVSSDQANVKESIDIILNTRKGERIMHPDFGLGLHQFVFRKMDEGLKGDIIDTVQFSLLHHEPRISVKSVAVNFSDTDGLITISVGYLYNQTNTRHNYTFPFFLKEGTNLD